MTVDRFKPNVLVRTNGVDRALTRPLYVQIFDDLRQQIESRHLPAGAALPTEKQLQLAYGVARSVIRQALDELASLGLIHRQRGRGTTVAPPLQRRFAHQAGGLRQQVALSGGDLRTEVLSLSRSAAPVEAATQLATHQTWRLVRLRRVDGQPIVYMETWLPEKLFPTLAAEDLSGKSLHDWIRSQRFVPEGGMRHLQSVPAGDIVAIHLEVALGTPVTLMEGVTRDVNGQGLEWFRAWHHPSTVFDVDARVSPPDPPTKDTDRAKVQELLHDLQSLLDQSKY